MNFFNFSFTEFSLIEVLTLGSGFCGVVWVTISEFTSGAGSACSVFTEGCKSGAGAGGAGAGYLVPGGVLFKVFPFLNGDGYSADSSVLTLFAFEDILSTVLLSVLVVLFVAGCV